MGPGLGGGSNFVFGGLMLGLFLASVGSDAPEIGLQLGCYISGASGLLFTFILSRVILSRAERWRVARSGREFWDVGLTSAVLNFLIVTASVTFHAAAIKYALDISPVAQPVGVDAFNQTMLTTAGAMIFVFLIPAAIATGWWQAITTRKHTLFAILVGSLLFPIFLLIFGILRDRSTLGRLLENPLDFALYCGVFSAIFFVFNAMGWLLVVWLVPDAQRAVIRMSRLVDDQSRLNQMIDELARLEGALPENRDVKPAP